MKGKKIMAFFIGREEERGRNGELKGKRTERRKPETGNRNTVFFRRLRPYTYFAFLSVTVTFEVEANDYQ